MHNVQDEAGAAATADANALSHWLGLAVEAIAQAGELFQLPRMSAPEARAQPTDAPGAFLSLTASEYTYLLGVQCPDPAGLGLLLDPNAAEASAENGMDLLGELLNIAAGVIKDKGTEADRSIELGLPVFAPGAIAPRSVMSREAVVVRFGDLPLAVSSLKMEHPPETRRRRLQEEENRKLQQELQLSQKLEAVGQLASGVAHEINTPLQYIGDNLGFLADAFTSINELADGLSSVKKRLDGKPATRPIGDELRALEDEADIEFVLESLPDALAQAREGVSQVTRIVAALREVGHPGTAEHKETDINRLVESALVVTRNQYKLVADLEEDYGTIPEVPCDRGQISQVVINIVVNAAHAIEDLFAQAAGDASGRRGTITVKTSVVDSNVVIEIADTGCGMPEDVRERIFDPFFTTKDVGRGTGQGLSIVRSIVVEKHAGQLDVESAVGEGTRFFIRLPVDGARPEVGDAAADDTLE